MTELRFKGKEFVYNHHLAVPFRPLVTHSEKGIGEPSLDGNLIIQGDNLHALKALLPHYAGKVDCIFIDPPYNTGNEGWCYSDNVNAPMIREWLAANPVGLEDSLRHDKWCTMMWPRLRLLYELLSDEGSIWITLDDNEVHRMRCILDEIFGDESLICNIVIQSNKRGHTYKKIAKTHEYLLVYGKTPDVALHEIETNGDNLPDEDQYGKFFARELRNRNPKFGRHNRPNLFFPLYVKNESVDENGYHIVSADPFEGSDKIYPYNSSGEESCWRWGIERVNDKIKSGSTEYLFAAKTRSGEWRIFEKYRKETSKAKTIWQDNKHILEQGTVELGRVGLADLFQFPKPLGILEDVISIATSDDAIILDSFAGSGTTAQAVLEANKRDGGRRRFILIEMEDYANELTAERIRRVIGGYDFSGTQKTELLRRKVTWSNLRKAETLVQDVEKIESLHGHEYDKIGKTVRDGELIVTGEKAVTERADGFGGNFTYCTLGPPLELDRLLSGENLPSFEALGAALFHMATSGTLDLAVLSEADFYVGEADGRHVWLIYRPDCEWLKTDAAALTLTRAREFVAAEPEGEHLVFAAARFADSDLLAKENLRVEFAPLPFALYRLDRN